jgi:hypothetical protein
MIQVARFVAELVEFDRFPPTNPGVIRAGLRLSIGKFNPIQRSTE